MNRPTICFLEDSKNILYIQVANANLYGCTPDPL